jgi:hypothetical protein
LRNRYNSAIEINGSQEHIVDFKRAEDQPGKKRMSIEVGGVPSNMTSRIPMRIEADSV